MKKFSILFTVVMFAVFHTKAQVKDIDGKLYKTVSVGIQEWMAENLDVCRYRNGDVIPHVTDSNIWKNLNTGAWCYYKNDPATGVVYGKLYNWYAVNDPRGLAPEGWQIPGNVEWAILVNALGGVNAAAGKMKATSLWVNSKTATNNSGLTLLPGGARDMSGAYSFKEYAGFWWSSAENAAKDVWTICLHTDNDSLNGVCFNKRSGFSVRCVRQRIFPVIDIDGNEYKTVKIGNQLWMLENLNVSKYRNGDSIPEVRDPFKWKNLTTGAWCYYYNYPDNGPKYGKLYNWYAVTDPRGLAPVGWHIPSWVEWELLDSIVGIEAGVKMKSTSYWYFPDKKSIRRLHLDADDYRATNSSGFTALPGGYRYFEGSFFGLTTHGYWWSSSVDIYKKGWNNPKAEYRKPYSRSLSYASVYFSKEVLKQKVEGFSVRCIRDY